MPHVIEHTTSDLLAGLHEVLPLLDGLGVRYAVTGSLAAVAWGVGRAVYDVDLVADVTEEQAAALRSTVDIVLPRNRPLDQAALERALRVTLADDLPPLPVILDQRFGSPTESHT